MNFTNRISTALHLKCPRCHEGRLFTGLLTMNSSCPHCGLVLEPDDGFYLGSIYANYGATVLIATSVFLILVFGYGFSKDVVVWGCVAFTVVFPLWFFRYARSIWLSLMYFANSSDFRSHRIHVQEAGHVADRQHSGSNQFKASQVMSTSR